DTRHYEQVADGCAEGLMKVALETGVPVCNGVLAVEQHADAEKRAGGSHGNKGEEAAQVALEVAELLSRLPGAPAWGGSPATASTRSRARAPAGARCRRCTPGRWPAAARSR